MRDERYAAIVGGVKVGGGAPVVVQSMTDTPTADIEATVAQVKALHEAGSQVVRLTVNDDDAAAALPHIDDKLRAQGVVVPLVGDFHYNGHRLLHAHPECAKRLAKYRINPGNVGFGDKHDRQFAAMIEVAMVNNKPVRIGVNWGSVDPTLASFLMDENAKQAEPLSSIALMQEILIRSVLDSARAAERLGLPAHQILVSCKVSEVRMLVEIYQQLARRCRYALHLGLTEAGMGDRGIIASSAALAILLHQGIGDTIRISITPEPGHSRIREVQVARQLLQSLGLGQFEPQVSACPGCGRTSSDFYQHLAQSTQAFLAEKMPLWRAQYPGVEALKLAVMGCVVNGPGESQHADIGISLPGAGEDPVAVVFVEGKKAHTLRGANIDQQYHVIIEGYVKRRFSKESI